jgi:signal transduction histidine kinase
MQKKCPIPNPTVRVRMLVLLELLRSALMLAIIIWWGWLLIDANKDRQMIYGEAAAMIVLVSLSTFLSLWFYLRDIRRARELKSFFASMAHELRNPLASIRLGVEALAQKTKSPITTRLINDTSRLEAQIERGLELARVESGKMLPLTGVDLAQSWKRALTLFPLSEQNRLKITQGKFTFVLAEEQCVQVIFRNLIENALAHAGKKTVSIFIHAETKDDQVMVTFRDNGAGFIGDKRKLGQLFYKGKQSKGTGLGLHLIQSLMRAQRGSAKFKGDDGFAAILTFQKV